MEAEFDVLTVMESILPPEDFWSPRGIGCASEDMIERYINQVVEGSGREALLAKARGSRHLATWKRLSALAEMDWSLPTEAEDYRTRWAWAFAARLPLEAVLGIDRGRLDLDSSKITWLPEDLHCPDWVNLTDTWIKTLPSGMRSESGLEIRRTGISELPTDLVVWGHIYIQGTPLAALPDEAIRAMAPGIEGRIER